MTLAGQKIGHYQVLRKLGEGGWGVVYAARDTRLYREVALKVLCPDLATDASFLERFQREARAVAALRHPNIVTIHSVENHRGLNFLTMECIEGRTLTQEIQNEEFDLDVFVERAISLTDAVGASHEAGIIHRDLKPDNIMIDKDGRTRVLDFGLAKVFQEPLEIEELVRRSTLPTGAIEGVEPPKQTAAGQVLGTICYMSPEQARGEEIDHRSDVFSLGAVLYEMATGQGAFDGRTAAVVFDAVLNRKPVSPRELNPALPRALSDIIEKALEKDRDLRHSSMAELRLELEQVARNAAAPRRSKWRTTLAAALGVAVALTLYSLIGRGKTKDPRDSYTPVQLTRDVGLEVNPTWAPDGSSIAYVSTRNGPADIYVHSFDTGEATLLASSEGDDLLPSWSPDSRSIAFLSGRDTMAAVYLIDADSGKITQLARTGVPAAEQLATAWQLLGPTPWSPDGSELLYSRLGPSGRIAVWKLNVNTLATSRLTSPPAGTDDLQASWSPDGKRIAFQRRGDRDLVYTMSPDGENPTLFVDDEHDYRTPTWSADSRHLFLVSKRGGFWGIWRADVDGSPDSFIQMTSGSEERVTRWPAVSRDGRIAYADWRHQTDLYIVPLKDGAQPERITSNTADNFGACFSPDSTRVLFHSTRSGNHEICVFDRGTRETRNLTSAEGVDIYPDWSPDGERISFLSNRDGAFRIWVMDSEGRRQSRLSDQIVPSRNAVHFVGRSDGPRWSPDGKFIGYLAPSDQGRVLWVVDCSTGKAREVEGLSAPVFSFDWYRDSNHVVYVGAGQDLDNTELRTVDLATGAESLLLTDHCAEIAMAADGSSVTYCRAISHFNMELFQLALSHDADTGLPRPVGSTKRLAGGGGQWHVHNGDVSATSEEVVYTRDTDHADILMLVPE